MSGCEEKKKSGPEKIKELLSKYITVNHLKACDIQAKKILLDDINVRPFLGTGATTNSPVLFDCIDCETKEPIKPDDLDQDVWDFLTENRKLYLKRTEEDLLRGREDIRCIRESYGCAAQCPPDCPIPEDCQLEECPTPNPAVFSGTVLDNVLTITEISKEGNIISGVSYVLLFENRNEVGQIIDKIGENQYLLTETDDITEPTKMETIGCPMLPLECMPNPITCDLRIPLKLYGTITVPYLKYELNKETDTVDSISAPSRLSYNLDVTNQTCNLATRTVTVLFHYAYKSKSSTPTQTPVNICPPCEEPIKPFECLYTGPVGSSEHEINCGVIRYYIKQFYFTINIEIGENIRDSIPIPTNIVQEMLNTGPETGLLSGAFQLAIFIEDGLRVENNFQNTRGIAEGDDEQLNTIDTIALVTAAVKLGTISEEKGKAILKMIQLGLAIQDV